MIGDDMTDDDGAAVIAVIDDETNGVGVACGADGCVVGIFGSL